MAQAPRDQNSVPVLLGVSSADGTTPVTIYVDPTTHRVLVQSASASTPAGADTQVQFNDGGAMGADAGLTYDKTTDILTVAGAVKMETANIEDSDASHYLVIKTTSNLTANRNFTIVPGDAARTLTMAGDINVAADLTTSGANALTLTTTGATNVTLPTTGTLATLAGAEALSNKTIGNTNTVTLKDTLFTLQDDGDATKLLAFQLSGITTGNTRTITMPDASGTVTLLGNASTGSGSVVLATSPTLVTPVLGVASATSINKVTITEPATSATLTLADGSSLVTSGANSITLTSTGATNVTLPTSGTLSTLAGAETLSNKTLTAPKIANAGFIADANGNELIIFTTTASAVNEITLANGATGVGPTFTASGEANVDINFQVKGTGVYNFKATTSGPADVRLFEDADNGTNYASLIAPASMAANRVLTLPDATDTLVGKATTDTLTNKRVTPRVSSETSSATPTINTDNVDAHSITALAVAVTSMTTNLSGTPTNFQKLTIRFKDDGTGRAITWGASFEAKGVALPTTTTASKVLTVGFIYDTVTSKWGCVASVNET